MDEALKEAAGRISSPTPAPSRDARVVAVAEYRDGSVIDVIRAL